jgi:hypothetical protein
MTTIKSTILLEALGLLANISPINKDGSRATATNWHPAWPESMANIRRIAREAICKATEEEK